VRAIGLRAAPKRVWFSVVESSDTDDQISLLVSQSLAIPVALTPPEQLRFIRQTIADTIDEYGSTRAGIRLAEPIAQHMSLERLHIEGVLQELLASSPVQCYFYGAIAKMASLLGVEARADVKQFIEGRAFRGIPGWAQMASEQRESILAAVAALAVALP